MSVARREWKSSDELRAWITWDARLTDLAPDRDEVPDLEIVYQPPKSGRANWRVIERPRDREGGARWRVAMRFAIARAELQFDLR